MDSNHTDPTNNQNGTSEQSSSEMPARYAELTRMVAAMQQDFHKFFTQGNKAAGTRVRQAMQELKNFAQAVRTEVQAIKNNEGSGN